MSEVVYLLGAGASYGLRAKNEAGEIIPGKIVRGLPVVNQLEYAINSYCKSIETFDPLGITSESIYSNLHNELKWLEQKCKTYPTIDTYAKKLTITRNSKELIRLKNALTSFFALIQCYEKRDLRYDGFVASIIQDDGNLPNNISILSWNYDCQLEYVLQDFSVDKTDIKGIWKKYGITCKGVCSSIDNSRFNFVKLNGTAMFSDEKGELVDPGEYKEEVLENCCAGHFDHWNSNISYAWEKDEKFINSVKPLIGDAKVLVVIGYSFPYVNRFIDRKLIQNMEALQNVYIQDIAADDVKQSFETLLSVGQQNYVERHEIEISTKTSVNQFLIPNELT